MDPCELTPGQQIGQATVLSFMRMGATGPLYRVSLAPTQETAVLKVLSHPGPFRIGKELWGLGARLGQLVHPALLTPLETHLTALPPSVLLAWAGGGSLEARLHVSYWGGFPLQETMRILQRVGTALSIAHEHGIVHSSLYPGCILFTEGAEVRLSGWDLAVSLDASPSFPHLPVDPFQEGYVAPEQWEGAVSVQSDVYALGRLAVSLLTGLSPAQQTPDRVIRAFAQRGVPTPSQSRALLRAIAPIPSERWEQVDAFLSALHLSEADERPQEEQHQREEEQLHDEIP